MTTYVALLRAVNVGGRQVRMTALVALFEQLGFGKVQTYIQSGNVVFASEEAEGPLRERLEREIAATFGFPVTVALRTATEMQAMLVGSPYPPDALAENERLYVAALVEAPTPEGVERLTEGYQGVNEWRILGREMYLLYRESMADTKLTNALIERRLGVAATSRNWRTMTALARMARVMEEG